MNGLKGLGITSLVLLGLYAAGLAEAALIRQPLEYSVHNQKFKSYLVYDDARTSLRPGILVFPEWSGLNDYAKMRADQLAQLGYVALAVDIYGDGKNTTDMKIAGQLSGEMKKDLPRLQAHAHAALEALAKQPQVDAKQLAAIGYCFGGTTVLALAYSGADVKGVVSFHGGLIVPEAADLPKVTAKILILHGAADPFTPAETIQKLQTTLGKSSKDWQMMLYSNAAHGFTNPNNPTDPKSPMAYNAVAAERAWNHMQVFFAELFPGEGKR